MQGFSCIPLPSGDVLNASNSYDVRTYRYFKADGSSFDFPFPSYTDSHGLEQQIFASFIASWGSKLYFQYNASDDGMYLFCFDAETKEWSQQKESEVISSGFGVGKYLILNYTNKMQQLCDMETGKHIGRMKTTMSYYGGDSHSSYGSESATFGRYPDNFVKGEEETVKIKKAWNTIPVCGKMYLMLDSAGMFLRSTDSDEEKIVFVYQK